MSHFYYKPHLATRKIDDLKMRAAFHEAGHAIAGINLKCPPKKARLYLKHDEWAGETINTIAGKPYRYEVHVLSGGYYSELLFTGVPNPNAARRDREHLWQVGMFQGNLTDDIIRTYQEELFLILIENWKMVESFAFRLHKLEHLSAIEIEEFILTFDPSRHEIRYQPLITD